MPLAAPWMDLEIIILGEGSQTERQISYDIAYMWNLTYLQNKQTHRHRKQNLWLSKVKGGKDKLRACD